MRGRKRGFKLSEEHIARRQAGCEAARMRRLAERFGPMIEAALVDGKVSHQRLLGMCIDAYWGGYRAGYDVRRYGRKAAVQAGVAA